MQEIHAISGGGRFFGGGGVGGGGDRRLRPHNHHHQNQQALKCPRCDSLNTKFCYYNNYNLSQPRHFCKNCRRYWTKGGVLRNVPVGGGCRKSKRSSNKAKNSSSSETVAAAAATTTSTPHTQPPAEPERKSNSHSSSESSSLTAANTTAAATEAVSAPTSNSDSNTNNNVLDNNMHESKLLIRQSSTPNPLEQAGAGDCGIFSEIGSFTSLITSANEAFAFGFGNNNTSPFRFSAQQGSDLLSGSGGGGGGGEWQQQKVMMSMGGGNHHHHHHHQDQDLKLPDITGGSLLDHTVPVDLSALHNKTSLGGFGSLDWHGGADQGLFDLSTNTVDHAYWSHTHWPDHDNPSLFHLP